MTKALRLKIITGVMMAIVITGGRINSYADTNARIESDLQSNESYSVNPSEVMKLRHWDKKPSGWRYLDENNKPILGYFYDTSGNFFYAKDTDGFIIENGYDIWGQYYNKDGYINISGYKYNTDNRYEALAKQLENGDNVYMNTQDEIKDFIEYYGKAYNMSKQTLNFRIYSKKTRSKTNGKVIKEEYFVNNSLNTIYNRDEVIDAINSLFPEHLVGDSLREKVKYAANYVANTLIGDDSDLNMTLLDAITNKKGCCWHFVKVMQHLLERDGINCEIITGKAYGVSHIWLRVKDENGAWIYSDPTFVSNKMLGFDDIDYRIYKDNYRVYNFFGS